MNKKGKDLGVPHRGPEREVKMKQNVSAKKELITMYQLHLYYNMLFQKSQVFFENKKEVREKISNFKNH